MSTCGKGQKKRVNRAEVNKQWAKTEENKNIVF